MNSDTKALAATLNDEPAEDVVRFTCVAGSDRYGVVREYARGGLGRILEANDRTLNRKVAIKELRVGGAANRARFVREAMITARLQHPSIVPLYDMGRWASGDPYYAMKLVAGRSFDQVIAGAETLDDRLALVPHVIAVADAMAYAHSQRIIHRDLKPQNVLVGDFGETVVIDWGLAKDLDRAEIEIEDRTAYRTSDLLAPLTVAGEVVGTPLYMAPEQAAGSDLDERADVYSIGAILYELLTGERPHRGASSAQVLARLINGDPVVAVEQLQPAVPPELATIVAKAMTFEREGRYRSAHELAADLRRFQTGQLVAAHRYSRGTLVRRWLHKHRNVVAVAAVLLGVLAVTVVAGMHRIIVERDATRAERDRLILVEAKGELDRDPTAAAAWLARYPADGADQAQARAIELDAEARGVARRVLPRDLYAYAGQASPDGTKFAQPSPIGLDVIDLETGAKLLAVPIHIGMIDWAPDGRSLVAMTIATPRTVMLIDLAGHVTPLRDTVSRLWDIRAPLFSADGATILVPTIGGGMRLHRHDGSGSDVWVPFSVEAYVRFDDHLAAVARDGSLWWWRLGSTTAHRLATPANIAIAPNDTVAFLDAGQLAAGTSDGRLCVWSLADGSVRVFGEVGPAVRELLASADGRTVVTFDVNRAVRVWQPATGASHTLDNLEGIVDLHLSHDGRDLLLAHRDHSIEVVDVATGGHRHVAVQPTPILAVTVSPDGGWVQSDDDSTTRLWRLRATPAAERVVAHGSAVLHAAIANDGETLVTGSFDTTAIVWTPSGQHVLAGHTQAVTAAAIASDAIVTASMDGNVRVWDRVTGAPRSTLHGAGGMIVELELAGNDAAVTTSRGGDVRAWDLDAGTSRALALVPGADFIALSPDREHVAVADRIGGLHLIPLHGGVARTLAGTGEPTFTAVYAPDGASIVGGTEAGHVVQWDLVTGSATVLATLAEHVRRVRFSHDGAWLAAADSAGGVLLWNTTTHASRTIAAASCEIEDIAFVEDAVLTTACDATIRAWSVADGSLRSLIHLDAQATVMRVSADGRYLVASTNGRESGFGYRIATSAFAPHVTTLASH